MNVTTIQATVNNVDLPIIQHLFKRLKIKTIVLDENKNYHTLNSYSEKTAQKIREARQEKERGELIPINAQMLWEN